MCLGVTACSLAVSPSCRGRASFWIADFTSLWPLQTQAQMASECQLPQTALSALSPEGGRCPCHPGQGACWPQGAGPLTHTHASAGLKEGCSFRLNVAAHHEPRKTTQTSLSASEEGSTVAQAPRTLGPHNEYARTTWPQAGALEIPDYRRSSQRTHGPSETPLTSGRLSVPSFLLLFSEDEVRKDRYVTFIFIGHISDFHDISPIPSSEIIFVLKAQTFCTFTVGSCFDTMWINIKNETANRAGPDSVHRKPSLLLCAPSPNPRLPLTPGRVAEATPNLGGDSTDRPRPPKSPTEGHGGVCGQLSPPRRALALKN